MKKNSVILFLVLLTIINIAALATFAYHRFHPKMHFPPMDQPDTPERFMKRELDLSEEQVKEFEAQRERFKIETEPILDSIQAKRKELMDEIAAEKPNVDKLDKLTEEIGALEITLKKKTTAHLLEGKALLTLEQQKKFFSLFDEGRDRMRRWRDHGKGIGERPGHPNFEEGE
jgi:Spy/CpxP family protein refolding chaperone